MACVLTTKTRLSMRNAPDIMAYARNYAHDFCSIERYVWHRIVGNQGLPAKSAFNTKIQQKFGVTKRTAKSHSRKPGEMLTCRFTFVSVPADNEIARGVRKADGELGTDTRLRGMRRKDDESQARLLIGERHG